MSRVQCYECKKNYDYYEDGFCPRCGAFNQPPPLSRIDANGNIVYHDGINERNHNGSFVHKEYHRENRKRAFTALEQDVRRAAVRMAKKPRTVSAERTGKSKGAGAAIGAVIAWLAFLSAILEIFN